MVNKLNNHLHLKSLNIKKTMTYKVWNPDPGFGEAQQLSGVKPVKKKIKYCLSWQEWDTVIACVSI